MLELAIKFNSGPRECQIKSFHIQWHKLCLRLHQTALHLNFRGVMAAFLFLLYVGSFSGTNLRAHRDDCWRGGTDHSHVHKDVSLTLDLV